MSDVDDPRGVLLRRSSFRDEHSTRVRNNVRIGEETILPDKESGADPAGKTS